MGYLNGGDNVRLWNGYWSSHQMLSSSALMLGGFMTSTFWGMAVDKYGHKPIILIGTASIIVFITISGFSHNLGSIDNRISSWP